jgi:hypothetical protein
MSDQETSAGLIKEKSGIEKSNEESHKILAAHLTAAGVTAEERYQLIAKAAYYRAEHRGFVPGAELEDWLAAEAEIDAMLGTIAAENR